VARPTARPALSPGANQGTGRAATLRLLGAALLLFVGGLAAGSLVNRVDGPAVRALQVTAIPDSGLTDPAVAGQAAKTGVTEPGISTATLMAAVTTPSTLTPAPEVAPTSSAAVARTGSTAPVSATALVTAPAEVKTAAGPTVPPVAQPPTASRTPTDSLPAAIVPTGLTPPSGPPASPETSVAPIAGRPTSTTSRVAAVPQRPTPSASQVASAATSPTTPRAARPSVVSTAAGATTTPPKPPPPVEPPKIPVTVKRTPRSLRLLIDGKEVASSERLELGAGRHDWTAVADDYLPGSGSLKLPGGESLEIELTRDPDATRDGAVPAELDKPFGGHLDAREGDVHDWFRLELPGPGKLSVARKNGGVTAFVHPGSKKLGPTRTNVELDVDRKSTVWLEIGLASGNGRPAPLKYQFLASFHPRRDVDVRLESEPSGATVMVKPHGRSGTTEVGKTPCDWKGAIEADTKLEFEFRLEGYETEKKPVTV
ncbi:MAG: hypothetical protein HY814_09840, partial [Candidatus Riflebacteria bacterium]|nr:hypothetical protein [Candidatus Riflebacteria bacterium]